MTETDINKSIEKSLIVTFEKIDNFFDWIIKKMPTIAKIALIFIVAIAVILSLQKLASSDELADGDSTMPKF